MPPTAVAACSSLTCKGEGKSEKAIPKNSQASDLPTCTGFPRTNVDPHEDVRGPRGSRKHKAGLDPAGDLISHFGDRCAGLAMRVGSLGRCASPRSPPWPKAFLRGFMAARSG